jgi:hypothetical protein
VRADERDPEIADCRARSDPINPFLAGQSASDGPDSNISGNPEWGGARRRAERCESAAARQGEEGHFNMAAAALLDVERQLEGYNDALSPLTHGADLSAYAAPLFIAYVCLSLVPTAVGLARHYYDVRRIFALNAATPLLVFLLCIAFVHSPVPGGMGDAFILLVVAGGFVLWISTLVDAAIGPAESPEES